MDQQQPLDAGALGDVGRLGGRAVDVGIAWFRGRVPRLVREHLAACDEAGGVRVVGGVGHPREGVTEPVAERWRRVAILAASVDPDAGQLARAQRQVADLDALPFERHRMEGLMEHARQQLLCRCLVQRAARAPDGHPVREAEGGEVGEPDHVVEMEVGQKDVELLHAVEQPRILDQPADARAGVDQDRAVAVAEQR